MKRKNEKYLFYKNKSLQGKYFGKDGACYDSLHIVAKYPCTKLNLIWQILSILCFRERSCQYQLRDSNDNILCKCQVTRPIFFFKFIPNKRKSYHIGPCVTPAEHRGNGYYPYLLSYILNKDNERKTYDYYMIINEKNIKSIRGVEKAGFTIWGVGRKRHGRYVLTSEIN